MPQEIVAIIGEMRTLYITLGVLTAGGSFGFAWALVRFGISRNAVDIVRIGGDVGTLYERTNNHETALGRLDERSQALMRKLDEIHNDIKKG